MTISRFSFSVGVLLFAVSTSMGREPSKQPETKVVLRISRQLIHRLIGVGFKHSELVAETMRGVSTRGTALAEGTTDVKVHESATESQVDLIINGEILTQFAATRRPIVVCAHGRASFRARHRIVFEHPKFTAEPVSVDVQNCFCLDAILNARGGPTGPLVRGIVRPFVRRGLADGNRQAEDQIRAQLSQSLGSESDKLLAFLNKAVPLVEQSEKMLVEKKFLPAGGLTFYRAGTKQSLLLSVGKPGQRIPVLPVLEKSKRAPVELWIARSVAPKQDAAELFLKHWRDHLEPLLAEQLRQRSPELAKKVGDDLETLCKEVSVVDTDGWRVVTFAPKLRGQLVVDIP